MTKSTESKLTEPTESELKRFGRFIEDDLCKYCWVRFAVTVDRCQQCIGKKRAVREDRHTECKGVKPLSS